MEFLSRDSLGSGQSCQCCLGGSNPSPIAIGAHQKLQRLERETRHPWTLRGTSALVPERYHGGHHPTSSPRFLRWLRVIMRER